MKSSSVITFAPPTDSKLRLGVYDLSGSLVRTLVNSQVAAGVKTVTWDGRSDAGEMVSSGIYFYRLEAGSFKATNRVVVVR